MNVTEQKRIVNNLNQKYDARRAALFERAIYATQQFPEVYKNQLRPGHKACAWMSEYILKVAMRIAKTATEKQIEQFNALEAAYCDIIKDLSYTYTLEFMLQETREKYLNSLKEIESLQKENEKLTKVLRNEL